MNKNLIKKVCDESQYLAVNAQTNATNYGFNMITKYPRADFVVIDHLEARLAAHDRDSPIEDVILELGFKNIIVTMGTQGAVGYDGKFERQTALTDKVVDTMGAGDAFLAVTSLYAAVGVPMHDLIKIIIDVDETIIVVVLIKTVVRDLIKVQMISRKKL